jgi:hypothetical protein
MECFVYMNSDYLVRILNVASFQLFQKLNKHNYLMLHEIEKSFLTYLIKLEMEVYYMNEFRATLFL